MHCADELSTPATKYGDVVIYAPLLEASPQPCVTLLQMSFW